MADLLHEKNGISIYCGDCRDILPTITPSSISLILSDPPYAHKNNDGDLIQNWEKACPNRNPTRGYNISEERRKQRKDLGGEARPIANDGVEANALVHWLIQDAKRLLVKGGNIALCCSGGGPGIEFAEWTKWLDEALDFKMMVIWNKSGMGIGWHYRRNYETILVATQPGAACKWYDKTDRIPNVIDVKTLGLHKIIPSAEQHPCIKPVQLMEFFIKLHTKKGDVVLDPFMGSGTTAEACVKMGRNFIGVEIDEHWANYAVNRVKNNAVVNTGFGVKWQ